MELDLEELESFEKESYRGLFEFGDSLATPGKVPLLIETPTGDRRQVEVNVDATVGELKSLVNSFSDFEGKSGGGEPGFDLVFGNNSLGADEDPLWRTTVLDTYETAGGFLRTVNDHEKGAATSVNAIKALDSTLAVVENVKQGGNDFDAMVQEALKASLHVEHWKPSTRASNANHRSELSEVLAEPRMRAAKHAGPIATTASQSTARNVPTVPDIIKTLSNQIPDVFPPKAANSVSRNWDAITPMSALPKHSASKMGGSQNEPLKDLNSNWLTSLMESWEDSILKGVADGQMPGGTTAQPTRKRGADTVSAATGYQACAMGCNQALIRHVILYEGEYRTESKSLLRAPSVHVARKVDAEVADARSIQAKYDPDAALEIQASLGQSAVQRELEEQALEIKGRFSRLQDVLTIHVRPDTAR